MIYPFMQQLWENTTANGCFSRYNFKIDKFILASRELVKDVYLKYVLFGGIIGECIILSIFNCYNQLK